MIRAAVLALALAACGEDMAKEVEKFADRACACKDAACAEQVVTELVAFAQKNRNARGDQERGNKAAQRLGACAIQAGMSQDKFIEQMQKLQELDNK